MKFNVFFPAFTILNTSGGGLWSSSAEEVSVLGIDLGYVNEEKTFGELRVFFDASKWDIDKKGLIYTDPKFEDETIDWLIQLGFAGDDLYYSEQGMQGFDFVSFDVGPDFLTSWENMK